MKKVRVVYNTGENQNLTNVKSIVFDTNTDCWYITGPDGGLIVSKNAIVSIGYEEIVEDVEEENVI